MNTGNRIIDWCNKNTFSYIILTDPIFDFMTKLLDIDTIDSQFSIITTNIYHEKTVINKHLLLIKAETSYYLITLNSDQSDLLYFMGNYYEHIKDYENMKKYYLMSYEKGDISALFFLANHFYEQQDYATMEKYYLMASEKGDIASMYNLAYYYGEIKDYANMEKYYLMAIKKGDADSLFNLTKYYNNRSMMDD